jgi:hypothetical protein
MLEPSVEPTLVLPAYVSTGPSNVNDDDARVPIDAETVMISCRAFLLCDEIAQRTSVLDVHARVAHA